MPIRYFCRHCQVHIGDVDSDMIDARSLGFHLLSEEERLEMINYDSDGNIIVKSICEDCQEALERNPDFHSLHTFIQ
ncbi:anti-sigma-F factor Fin family protein [Calidifontibacillus erzurumensis]|uniref:Anti-sigma-F factor Fin family protein n=1 Tax=Calidifontibacillus erzurumensis TaxID=2741433 RepID=A0A8J8GFA7_9BACI|nr:anti-sigma-F factor Fin family protein [Calidifontibacillus erzurumensis]NSL52890.1 anti-sigma-F factor Fin family protein [Calidifontibacillus erzurumensis]